MKERIYGIMQKYGKLINTDRSEPPVEMAKADEMFAEELVELFEKEK